MKKIKKENKEQIINLIEKAGDPENYQVSWNEKGIPQVIEKAKIKRGALSKKQGGKFELKVRKDLEKKGKIVDKWTNNVEFEKDSNGGLIFSTGKLIIARKYNPFKKLFILGAGFPDFIAMQHSHDGFYRILGIEAKMNGILSKEEKEKCVWYLQNQIFSDIWIAEKGEKKGEIKYTGFLDKYKKYDQKGIIKNNNP